MRSFRCLPASDRYGQYVNMVIIPFKKEREKKYAFGTALTIRLSLLGDFKNYRYTLEQLQKNQPVSNSVSDPGPFARIGLFFLCPDWQVQVNKNY